MTPVNVEEDTASVIQWQRFLEDYGKGAFSSIETPPLPPIPSHLNVPSAEITIAPKPWAFETSPLYTADEISLDQARKIRDYYCEHGYLPPPRSPFEASRHACIAEYDLYSPKQLANIQAATDLVAEYFQGTVCTFSLFHDHIQKHFTLSGSPELIAFYALEAGMRIPAEDSLCGHAVLFERSIFYVSDLKNDWRYFSNPFVQAGFKSFIGSAVSLQLDPLNQGAKGPRIGVGTLNICFIEEPLRTLSPSQRKVVAHITSMLETQLRATWEGDQRTKEGRARMALSDFIEDSLEDNKQGEGPMKRIERLGQSAVDRIASVLPDLNDVVVLDTSAVHIAVSGAESLAEDTGGARQRLMFRPASILQKSEAHFKSSPRHQPRKQSCPQNPSCIS